MVQYAVVVDRRNGEGPDVFGPLTDEDTAERLAYLLGELPHAADYLIYASPLADPLLLAEEMAAVEQVEL